MIADKSIERTRLFCKDYGGALTPQYFSLEREFTSGTSFATIRLARPSRIAVLPTPGGPMS